MGVNARITSLSFPPLLPQPQRKRRERVSSGLLSHAIEAAPLTGRPAIYAHKERQPLPFPSLPFIPDSSCPFPLLAEAG